MSKPQRWYAIEGRTLYVYDQPYREKSLGVSIVSIDDLPFYRNNFQLRKVWDARAA